MKPNRIYYFVSVFLWVSLSASFEPVGPRRSLSTFQEWKDACVQAITTNKCAISKQEFIDELDAFLTHFKSSKSNIIQAKNWIPSSDSETQMPGMSFLLQTTFEPFVMKIEVEKDEKTAFIGDIHGDIESFNTFLESLAQKGITDPNDPFKINSNSYVIFLGDYSDRGKWGVEVLYGLARFIRVNTIHEKNVQRVIACRGNHEDLNLYELFGQNLYVESFKKEIQSKFGDESVLNLIEKFYNCMPLALFLKSGSHALLACHGGIELGFLDSKKLLNSTSNLSYMIVDKLYRHAAYKKFPYDMASCFFLLKSQGILKDFDPRESKSPLCEYGFLWSDYEFEPSCYFRTIPYNKGRGIIFPEHIVKEWFTLNSSSSCSLIGNIRGHQHSKETMPRILNRDNKSDPEEKGLAKLWMPDATQPPRKLWPGIVCTLCACPNTMYGSLYDYDFGAYCILETGLQLDDWNLRVHHFYSNQFEP